MQSRTLLLEENKRATLLFLLVVKITIFVKPSSYTVNHQSFASIIVARDNAETLDAQGSGSVFSFHRVVDTVQMLVLRCSMLPVRWVQIVGRGWPEV